MPRTTNEQQRGLYRLISTPRAGELALKRTLHRLYGVEWRMYPEEQRRAIVGVAADHVIQCWQMVTGIPEV